MKNSNDRSAIHAVASVLQIPRSAQVTEHGKPFTCPTTGYTHIQYTVHGLEGHFTAKVKIEHIPPFQAVV